MSRSILAVALLALAGCASQPLPPKPAAPESSQPVAPPTPAAPAQPAPPAAVVEPVKPAEPDLAQPDTGEPAAPLAKPAPAAMPWLKASGWDKLPGWGDDDLRPAWPALLESCKGLKSNPAWIPVCQDAARLPPLPENSTLRDFFEQHFLPWQVNQTEGGVDGLITGYYEPLLRGSRQPTPSYRFPLYAAPDDLLIVDLSALYPELKNLRLRGRLQGRKVVPYYSRAEIESGQAPVKGKELAWVDDAVELFFLQIQGSGRLRFEDGEVLRIGYADQNGHPYRSIGKWLVEKGELTLDKASMQGIKDWGLRNPQRLPELLNANPSYVFFRTLPASNGGPLGALGVPLTPERSVAVDPRAIPLGAPLWLDTTRPNSDQPLQRLMLAQDTGGAIRGNVRADFFWGFGDEAGKLAGAMKQKGRVWLLLPRDFPLSQVGVNSKLGLK
jgi:membrane-bound lytic murein transglycosylase A